MSSVFRHRDLGCTVMIWDDLSKLGLIQAALSTQGDELQILARAR